MISTRHRPLLFGAFLLPRMGVLHPRLTQYRRQPSAGPDRGDTPRIETSRDPHVRPRTMVRFEHEDDVVSAAFSPDLSRVATGSNRGNVRIWDLTDPAAAPLELETEAGGWITGVAFSPDGAWLAAVGDRKHLTGPDGWDGIVRVWDLADPAAAPLVLDYADRITAVAFSPDGRTLATATWDGNIRLQNLDDLRSEPIVLRDHGGWVFSIDFTPNGDTLASSSELLVLVWDLTGPSAAPLALGHDSTVLSLAFSWDGTHLATGSWHGQVQVRQLADLTAPPVVLDTDGGTTCVAWSPDGATLAAGSADETVSIWQPADPAAQRVKLDHGDWVVSVAFSPDGRTLGTCGEQTARLWDTSGPGATPA